MTLRVAQFVLKIAHLAISMEPRGPPTLIMIPVRIVLFLYAGGQIEHRSKVFGMLCLKKFRKSIPTCMNGRKSSYFM